MTEERKALPPPFPPAHQPVGFSPQMGQRVGCLPDIGSSCGQQLESFSVTWTALEENLGRDGLGSYSTMWKTAGQPPLTTKAACNGTATPFGTLPLKALWPALGWAEEHIRHHHNPRRDDRSKEDHNKQKYYIPGLEYSLLKIHLLYKHLRPHSVCSVSCRQNCEQMKGPYFYGILLGKLG